MLADYAVAEIQRTSRSAPTETVAMVLKSVYGRSRDDVERVLHAAGFHSPQAAQAVGDAIASAGQAMKHFFVASSSAAPRHGMRRGDGEKWAI